MVCRCCICASFTTRTMSQRYTNSAYVLSRISLWTNIVTFEIRIFNPTTLSSIENTYAISLTNVHNMKIRKVKSGELGGHSLEALRSNVLKVLMEKTVKPHVLALLWSEEFLFRSIYTVFIPQRKMLHIYVCILSLLVYVKLSYLRARTSALS